MDERDHELMKLILACGGSIDCDDDRLDEYQDDRGQDDDTINRLINLRCIRQMGSADFGENFWLEAI